MTISKRSLRLRMPCTSSPSPMLSPTGMRGSSDENGSWKMICMSRRRSFSSRLLASKMLRPSKVTSPLVAGISRRMVRPTVVLPQPDSPTRPRVSPGLMAKLTSSTACTQATTRCSKPPRTGKYLTRFLTSTRLWPFGLGLWVLISALTIGRLSRAHRQRGLMLMFGAAVIQPAAHLVVVPGWQQLRQHFGADGQVVLHPRPAARRKPAALRQVDQVGHHARDDVQRV